MGESSREIALRTLACTGALFAAFVSGVTGARAHEMSSVHRADSGTAGTRSQVTRVIHIVMTDAMRFEPAAVTVNAGQTVRFVVENRGRSEHEFILGNSEELAAHAEMMKAHPDMPHHGPNALTLQPHKSGEIVWRFGDRGPVAFACLRPGHYEAGMRGSIIVEPNANGTHRSSLRPADSSR